MNDWTREPRHALRALLRGYEADGVEVSLGFPPSTTVVLSPIPANG